MPISRVAAGNMFNWVSVFIVVFLCFCPEGVHAGERTATTATIRISLTIPPKHWRDTRRLEFAASAPAILKECLQAVAVKAGSRSRPQNFIRTCLPDTANMPDAGTNGFVMTVAGI